MTKVFHFLAPFCELCGTSACVVWGRWVRQMDRNALILLSYGLIAQPAALRRELFDVTPIIICFFRLHEVLGNRLKMWSHQMTFVSQSRSQSIICCSLNLLPWIRLMLLENSRFGMLERTAEYGGDTIHTMHTDTVTFFCLFRCP